jgi:tetratricopeptide (TPR) repeat protein
LAAAVAVGALTFLAHGFVDVSGHRMGTVWPMLLLVGMLRRREEEPATERRASSPSFASGPVPRAPRPAGRREGKVAVRCWRLSAGVVAAASLGWLGSSFGKDVFPNSTVLERARWWMARAQETGQYDSTVRLATAALRFAPLNWELYFYRALGRLYAAGEIDGAIRDFRRARWLEPNLVEVPFQEGLTWLAWQPPLALGAWHEALRRPSADKAALYRRMWSETAEHAELRDDLRLLALDDPELLLVFLEQATPTEASIEIERLLEEDPDLARLTDTQRQRLFLLWAGRGDRERLAAKFDNKPQWREASWLAHALVLAGQGNVEAACQLAQRAVAPPALPPVLTPKSVPDLQRDLLMRPDDFVAGFALYHAQRRANQPGDALATLRRLTSLPDCPPYLHYLEAQLAMELGQWEIAWRAWRRFLGW